MASLSPPSKLLWHFLGNQIRSSRLMVLGAWVPSYLVLDKALEGNLPSFECRLRNTAISWPQTSYNSTVFGEKKKKQLLTVTFLDLNRRVFCGEWLISTMLGMIIFGAVDHRNPMISRGMIPFIWYVFNHSSSQTLVNITRIKSPLFPPINFSNMVLYF